VEDRRVARIGTVSGLALLAGGTAVAAVAGGAHSIFATILLGMLAAGMGHALVDEIRRQARRESPGWASHDTINTGLLATWSVGTLIAAVLAVHTPSVRAVGLTLSLGYALSCAHFVLERRHTIATPSQTADTTTIPEPDPPPIPEQIQPQPQPVHPPDEHHLSHPG
jgi:hypothetical protein